MSDGKGTWGGKREGAGRPKGWRKGFSEQRKQHQVRAYDDEWQLILRFAKAVKHGNKEACTAAVEKLEQEMKTE